MATVTRVTERKRGSMTEGLDRKRPPKSEWMINSGATVARK